ncbi:MAG: plasmid replication protein, CyRepA1 family [Coleofasciculaceae cyanobacterium]
MVKLNLEVKNPFRIELEIGSQIDSQLAALNTSFIQGNEVYEALLYAKNQQSLRRNDGRLRDWWLRRYEQIADDGALYFSGLDPQQNWTESSQWGRLKPVSPYTDRDEKQHKYESPLSPASYHPLYFRVTLDIWQLIATRYSVDVPENILVTDQGEAKGFWNWLAQHPEIPRILVEGEKKALCLLSMGLAAIALPGIWCGRVGNKLAEKLHPDLFPLAHKKAKFIFCFDYETKPKTKWQVFQAITRTGKCLVDAGSTVEVAVLPGPEKGIDDWLVALGSQKGKNLDRLFADALSLKAYRQQFSVPLRGLKKYKPDVLVNTPRLGEVIKQLPTSGTVVLDSDMSTGKTHLMQELRQNRSKERFLNVGHRVNLLRNLGKRLETEMYSSVQGTVELSQVQALSITVDSLYKMARGIQAYGVLFVDEACQVVAHLLHSKTCKRFRAEILDCLEYLVYNSELVVLADAHINDVTIDFFMAMRPPGEKPYIIKNRHKVGKRKVYWYTGPESSAITLKVHEALMQGLKPMVVSDSKAYIKKLELTTLPDGSAIKTSEIGQTPEGNTIWSIHSENSGSPENVEFIKNISSAVKGVEALLSSPSLGSGVDICGSEGDYHFDLVLGAFFAGSQPATECAQQLWRYRPDVDMHIWVAPRPIGGYRETNTAKIKEDFLWKNEANAFLLRLDRETGKRGAEKDWALQAYCEIEARRNRSINNLRADLRALLEEMGNRVIEVGDFSSPETTLKMKEAKAAIDEAYCQGIVGAENISKAVYEARQRKDYLSPDEFYQCEKFRIRDAYGMEVTPELVEIDDRGKYLSKIANLDYILAEPETFIDKQDRERIAPPLIVSQRDLSDREFYPLSFDWGNRSGAWWARYVLGLRDLLVDLMQGGEYRACDELVIDIADKARKNAASLKILLGRTITADSSNNKIIGELLSQLGLKTRCRQEGIGTERVRVYKLADEVVDFAHQVLLHRQRRREEKERLREERLRLNAEHAARIKQQCGSPALHTPPLNEDNQILLGGVCREDKTPDMEVEKVEVSSNLMDLEVETEADLPLELYKLGDEVWFYHPLTEQKWLKGVIEQVGEGSVRAVSGFFGMLIEDPAKIAPAF